MKEYNNVVIEQEDGTKYEYEVLALFDVADNSYVALLPTSENKNEITFFGCTEDNSTEELELINIEDDKEFEFISNVFTNLLRDSMKEDLENE